MKQSEHMTLASTSSPALLDLIRGRPYRISSNPRIASGGSFLSIGGRDAEERISRLLEVIPENSLTYKSPFQHLTEHKLGVELLAPRHEKLYFEGTGLSRRLSKRSFEPPLTPEQRERWANVFETLVWNLWCVNAVHPCEFQLTERLMI